MLAIASDHAGYALKENLKQVLSQLNISFKDLGCYDPTSVDYPLVAKPVIAGILKGEYSLGILICGTGIGMSIYANRHKGIRAALCNDFFTAKMAKEHNDANVLCLGGKTIGPGLATEIVKIFLKAKFKGERHARRLQQIELDLYTSGTQKDHSNSLEKDS
jgi:ribose 5-phosphate isomerase B